MTMRRVNTGSGTDNDAIHDNVAAEISAIANKATPVSADVIIIEDSADSFNKKKVTIANLPSGTPAPHAIGGSQHTVDTLANFNSKISDATLDDSGDSRTPSGSAGGDLSGTYPSPGVNDGADGSAIHDDNSGEIFAIAAKATPVSGDLLLIEDSADGNAKKKVTAASIVAVSHTHTESDITDLDHTDTNAIHDNVAGEIAAVILKLTPVSSDHVLIEDSASADAKKSATLGTLAGLGPPQQHAIGGAQHSSSTLAALNALVSDATLDDAGDSRPPSGTAGGQLGGTYPNPTVDDGADGSAIHDNESAEISAITLKATPIAADHVLIEDSAAVNVKKRATAGSIAASGPPQAHSSLHENGGADEISVLGLSGLLADAQTPTSHALAGAEHSTSTLAQLNTKVSDATLDDSGDSRSPSGTAGGDLNGTYPNPSVDDGADATAIHDNVSGEIGAITEKVSPVGADVILIEDSAAGGAKKRVSITNLPGGADADAIHDNVDGEINAIASKATPVSADVLLIEDSAASFAKKKITIADLPGAASPLDTKGDLYTFSTVDAKLPVGANGYSPVGDTTAALGLQYVPAGTTTGLLTGGAVTVATDPAEFDVAAGTAIIWDWTTGNANPKLVSWSAFDDQAVTDIGTTDFTTLFINTSSGLIQFQDTLTSGTQRRELVPLQTLVHPGSTIISISGGSQPAYDVTQAILDYVFALGPVNSGNIYAAAATNLETTKGLGTTTQPFINRAADTQENTIKPNGVDAIVDITYTFRDGASGHTFAGSTVTDVDVGNFDDNDVGGPVAVSPISRFQIKRFFFFGQTETTTVSYGQVLYNSLADAELAIFTENPDLSPILSSATFTTALIVQGNTTDLSDTGDAKFVEINLGVISSGGTGSGDVVGPGGATDEAIARYDTASGKLLQDSPVTITDAGAVAGATTYNGVVVENHSARHENGGADEISVAGLSGLLADSQTPAAHALGGAEHTADTLANLNTKVSDATLDDSGDSRTPSGTAGGDLGGTYPNPTVDDGADSTAVHDNEAGEINAVASKATPVGADIILIEDSAAGFIKKKVSITDLPGGADADAVHVNVANEISGITLKATPVAADLLIIEDSAASNVKKRVTASTIASSGPPASHAIGGSEHSASTLANLNTKVSDATLDDSGDSRPPSGTAGGDLGGTYPNPTVDDGADGSAIHDDTSGEINAIAAKTTAVATDILLIEDSGATNAKKKLLISGIRITESQITDLDHTDDTAIHDNVASEISAITLKASPAGADHVLIEDSAAANIKKRTTSAAIAASGPPQAHTIASHSDTTATGAELETLTDGSNADTLHVHTFLAGLSDTPSSYSGQAGKSAVVNDAETALEFRTISGGGAIAFEWNWLTDVADTDPGSGNMKGNNATQLSITQLNTSDTNANGKDLSTLLDGLAAGNVVIVTEESDSTRWIIFELSADSVDNSTYWALTGTVAQEGPGGDIRNNRACGVQIFFSVAAAGDVFGPGGSVTDNALVRWDTTSGTLIQNAVGLLTDAGALSGITTVNGVTVENHSARHENGGSDEISVAGLSGALADAQTPISHAIGGAEHSASTLAAFNAKISDATLDDSGDSRTPSGTAGGDLNGTYPNPLVDDGADATAIHDDTSGEINSIAAKTTAVAADILLIEDSAATNAKKKLLVSGLRITESQITDLDHTDTDAIHDNVSGEISLVTEKTTLVGADLLLIEDSAASNAKKRVQLSNLPTLDTSGAAGIVQTSDGSGGFESGNLILVNESNISLRGPFTTASSSSGTLTLDYSVDQFIEVTLTENVTTITVTMPSKPTLVRLRIIQDPTTARTMTGWAISGGAVRWQGGVEYVPTPELDAIDKVVLDFDGTDIDAAYGLAWS